MTTGTFMFLMLAVYGFWCAVHSLTRALPLWQNSWVRGGVMAVVVTAWASAFYHLYCTLLVP